MLVHTIRSINLHAFLHSTILSYSINRKQHHPTPLPIHIFRRCKCRLVNQRLSQPARGDWVLWSSCVLWLSSALRSASGESRTENGNALFNLLPENLLVFYQGILVNGVNDSAKTLRHIISTEPGDDEV